MTNSIASAALKKMAASAIAVGSLGGSAFADNITYVSGSTGNAIQLFADLVKPWEESTGHTVTIVPMPNSTTDQFGQYRLWLAAGNEDVDVYQTDVIWAPQLAEQFVDRDGPTISTSKQPI